MLRVKLRKYLKGCLIFGQDLNINIVMITKFSIKQDSKMVLYKIIGSYITLPLQLDKFLKK